VNSFRADGRKSSIEANLVSFPSAAILTFVEAKIQESDITLHLAENKAVKDKKKAKASDPFSLANFTPHFFPFRSNSSGVLNYVSNNTQYRSLTELNVTCDDGSMIVFAEVCISGLRFILGTVYIHPSICADDFNHLLASIAPVVEDPPMPVLLVGDFNTRHPQFGDDVPQSSRANSFVSFLNSFSLTVLNTLNHFGVSTTESGSGSVLDLVITTHPHLFSMELDIFPVLSDHLSISVEVLGPDNPLPPTFDQTRWNTAAADWSAYHNLTQARFNSFTDIPSAPPASTAEAHSVVDRAAAHLSAGITTCADQCMPRARPRVPFTYTAQPHHDQLAVLRTVRNQIRKLKSRVRRDVLAANLSDFAHQRRSNLCALIAKRDYLHAEWT
ncbi:MAG: hypothetical protein ABL994_23250, partial [Verrucomicrobiales bacterium]